MSEVKNKLSYRRETARR